MSLSSVLFDAIRSSTRGFVKSRESAYQNAMERFSTATSCVCSVVETLPTGRLRKALEGIGRKACEVVVGSENIADTNGSLREIVNRTKAMVVDVASKALKQEAEEVRQVGLSDDSDITDGAIFKSTRQTTDLLNSAVAQVASGVVKLYKGQFSEKLHGAVSELVSAGIIYEGDVAKRRWGIFSKIKFPKLNLAKDTTTSAVALQSQRASSQVEKSVQLLATILTDGNRGRNDEHRLIALCDMLRYMDDREVRAAIEKLDPNNPLRKHMDSKPGTSIKELLTWDVVQEATGLLIGRALSF